MVSNPQECLSNPPWETGLLGKMASTCKEQQRGRIVICMRSGEIELNRDRVTISIRPPAAHDYLDGDSDTIAVQLIFAAAHDRV